MKRLRITDYLLIATILVASGCAQHSVAPKENQPTQIAFSGNQQNAGVLGWADDGGSAINSAKRDEYNALIDLYGKQFAPPLKHDDGVAAIATWTDKVGKRHTGAAWSIDKEHVTKFALMKSWEHRGDKPAGTTSP